MPDDFDYVHDEYGDPQGIHGEMMEYGDDMIIFPHRHPHMIRLNKKNGTMTHMAEGFFKDSDRKGIGYELKKSSICGSRFLMGKDKIVVQRNIDMHMAVIDLEDGSYKEFLPELTEEMFDKLVPEDAGFFKGDTYDYFRMQESRMFPLENFIETFKKGGYDNIKNRQLKELSGLASNLDGTCGIKVHEFLKKMIREEDER